MREHLSVEKLAELCGQGVVEAQVVAAAAHISQCDLCLQRLKKTSKTIQGFFLPLLVYNRHSENYRIDDYSGVLADVLDRMSEEGSRLDQERRVAAQQVDELRQVSPSRRELMIRNSAQLQSWGLAEALLEATPELWTEDPAQAESLARSAVIVLEQLSLGGFRERVRHDLMAEAWSYIGNCLRIQSDLVGAGEAMKVARELLERGTGDPLERARLEDLESSLLRERRDFAGAERLLRRAIEVYKRHESSHLEGRALLKLGKTMGDAGTCGEACLEVLEMAVAALEVDGDAYLQLVSRMQLLFYLNEAGRSAEAHELLPEVRGLAKRYGNRLDTLRLLWLEGNICRSLGRVELAEEALKQVRAGFIDAEIGYDVALVSLDLAALYLESGRTAEVKELAAEMLPQFAARQIHREALAAIALFEQAARKERATLALVEEISSKVKGASTRRTTPQNN